MMQLDMARPKRRKPGKRGGVRENAGRPSLSPGKTIKRTFRFTPEASAAIDREAERLTDQEGRPITASDAVDKLVLIGDAIVSAKSVTSAWSRIRKAGKVR